MGDTTTKTFLCKVQNCPMEDDDAPMDDKMAHENSMKKVFGDEWKLVKCDKVLNKSEKIIFCEMLIKTDKVPNKKHCPKGFQIIMEVEE